MKGRTQLTPVFGPDTVLQTENNDIIYLYIYIAYFCGI